MLVNIDNDVCTEGAVNVRKKPLTPILVRLLLAGTVALAGCGDSGGSGAGGGGVQKPVVFLDQSFSADDR